MSQEGADELWYEIDRLKDVDVERYGILSGRYQYLLSLYNKVAEAKNAPLASHFPPNSKTIEWYVYDESGKFDAQTVAEELHVMHHLHTNTHYSAVLETRLREAAQHLKQEHPKLPWGELWRLLRLYAVDAVKISLDEEC